MNTTDVNGKFTANEIVLYPNPASGFITLNNPKNHHYAIDFMDLTGTIISSLELDPKETFQVDISDKIPDGLYFVHWRWGNDFATTRIVIQKR